jgi:PAS domain-containing protein
VTGVSDRQMGRQLTLHALRQDGTEFPIEASISQTSDGAGHKLFTVMLRDVTARVRAEAALQRSREELQALSDSILARARTKAGASRASFTTIWASA